MYIMKCSYWLVGAGGGGDWSLSPRVLYFFGCGLGVQPFCLLFGYSSKVVSAQCSNFFSFSYHSGFTFGNRLQLLIGLGPSSSYLAVPAAVGPPGGLRGSGGSQELWGLILPHGFFFFY